MALDINNTYGASTPADADYPYGSAKNETTPGDLDGTPLEKAGFDDIYGLMQSLLICAGVVPNGNPDTVQAPQYLASIFNLRWYDKIDFAVGTKVVAGDGLTYVCGEASGPSTSPQNPVTESAPRTKWLTEGAFTFGLINPVGSIHLAHNSINPGDQYGVGTWVRIKGKFLIGVDELQSDYNTAGETGGTRTHNHSDNFSVANHTLTLSQIPSHSHTYQRTSGGNNGGSGQSYPHQVQNDSTAPAGGGQPHNHGLSGNINNRDLLPPFQSVYMWRRIA